MVIVVILLRRDIASAHDYPVSIPTSVEFAGRWRLYTSGCSEYESDVAGFIACFGRQWCADLASEKLDTQVKRSSTW